MNVTFYRVYENTVGDPTLINVNGKMVTRVLEWPYRRDATARGDKKTKPRLRGFLFTQNGALEWPDQPDSDALVNVGRVLAGLANLGAFHKPYLTSRRHGGFIVYFERSDDAETFLNQGILNPATYKTDNLLTAYIDLAGQKASQKLPGPEDRRYSDPLPGRLSKDLFYYVPTAIAGEYRRCLIG
jgi:hypothetical protein